MKKNALILSASENSEEFNKFVLDQLAIQHNALTAQYS